MHSVAVAIAAGDPTKNVAALEQEAKRSVEPGIQWFFAKIQCRFVQHVERIQGC